MKTLCPLYLAAICSCSLLFSSCEKQSDSVTPASPTKAVTNNDSPTDHGYPYIPIGGTYYHYPVLTGAGNGQNINMVMVDNHVTGAGNKEEWESCSSDGKPGAVVSSAFLPLDSNGQPVSLPYNFLSRVVVTVSNGVPVLITAHTRWNTDGTVSMVANVNLKSVK